MKFNMLLLFIKLLCHNCYYEKIGSNDPVKLEDLPFDIPDNWMWVRLKNISSLIGGYAFKSEKFCKEGIRVIRISDFDEKGIKNKDIKRYPYSIDLDSYRILPEDILLCMTGGTVGKSFHIKTLDEYCYINQRVALIRIQNINTDYFYSVLTSSYISNVINTSKTSTNDNISMKLIEDFLVPLPPLNEQLNIIEKIKSCEPLINRYDELEKKLTSLELEFPEKFKKSILQYAIEGKLVKQDPNDEPASVLLERIKTEKEKLIKEGKIKQDKNESYIYQGDDKNYYENLPSGWAVSRLSQIIILTSGTDLSPEEYSANNIGVPYLTGASNISDKNEIIINRYTNEKFINSHFNEILLSCKGTIGKIVYNNIGDIHVARQFMSIRSFIDKDFLIFYLKTLVDRLIFEAKSMIPGIDRNQILTKTIFLPPIQEQSRIKKKVISLFDYIQ